MNVYYWFNPLHFFIAFNACMDFSPFRVFSVNFDLCCVTNPSQCIAFFGEFLIVENTVSIFFCSSINFWTARQPNWRLRPVADNNPFVWDPITVFLILEPLFDIFMCWLAYGVNAKDACELRTCLAANEMGCRWRRWWNVRCSMPMKMETLKNGYVKL